MGYLREIEIDAPIDQVWHAFTAADELQHWLCERARVVLEPGGAFDCYWGPEADRSSKGSRIVAVEPQQRLAVQFRAAGNFTDLLAPPSEPPIIDVRFESRGAAGTKVVLEQPETREVQGWAAFDEWAADAWEDALIGLKQHCEEGGTSVVAREAFLH